MKWNLLRLFVYGRGLLLIAWLFAFISLDVFMDHFLQPASACQCVSRSPQLYDERSDAIFIGRVIHKDYNVPIENAYHVTFNVSKSWKGIETNVVTVHIDDAQCNAPLVNDEEYLVYAYKDLFEVRMPTCAGTTMTDNQLHLEYLDSRYLPIQLESGQTGNVNLLSIIQILGALIGISAVAFIVLARRR